ncbi:MAG TPA: methylamine utilization protein MauJ [Terriglobia bacterium]|nr:methylamine utilization protein MauJ [Terriglobia bacterium]
MAVNHYRDPDDPRNLGAPKGLPGDYESVFVLNRPGFNLISENQHSFAEGMEGDSHLAISKPALSPPGNPEADQILINGDTEDGHFEFIGLPNQRGYLGKIKSKPFQADDLMDAARKCYRALASSLSKWSAELDVPLHLFQVESKELRTGNAQMSIVTAFREVPLAIRPNAHLEKEFRGYASLYREALNSTAVYQFLCFFKIAEAISARRKRLERQAKREGKDFSRPDEVVPGDPGEFVPWLRALFHVQRDWDEMSLESIFQPVARGMQCADVIAGILKPLRDTIGHALGLLEGEELTLSADELLHTEEVNRWLPLTKCIIRRMLKNEFPADFLPYLKEDGTVTD